MELCDRLIPSFAHTSGDMTDVQRHALERFDSRSWWGKYGLQEKGIDLPCLVDIFDDFFFCGTLKDKVRIAWVEWYADMPYKGLTMDDPNNPDHALIWIATLGTGYPWSKVNAKSLIGTLLHEMVLAFLRVFACCCCSCSCAVSGDNARGFHGHGAAFIRLATAVEEEANLSLRPFTKYHWEPHWDLAIDSSTRWEHKAPKSRKTQERVEENLRRAVARGNPLSSE